MKAKKVFEFERGERKIVDHLRVGVSKDLLGQCWKIAQKSPNFQEVSEIFINDDNERAFYIRSKLMGTDDYHTSDLDEFEIFEIDLNDNSYILEDGDILGLLYIPSGNILGINSIETFKHLTRAFI